MAHVFQCNVFQQNVFQNTCAVVIDPGIVPGTNTTLSIPGKLWTKKKYRELLAMMAAEKDAVFSAHMDFEREELEEENFIEDDLLQ